MSYKCHSVGDANVLSTKSASSRTITKAVKFSHRWAIDNFAYFCFDKPYEDDDKQANDIEDAADSSDSSDSELDEDELLEPEAHPEPIAIVVPVVDVNIDGINNADNDNDNINGDNENPIENRNGEPQCRRLKSSTFCSPTDEKLRFFIDLWPNGSSKKYKDFLGVFLNLEPKSTYSKISIQFQFVILGENGEDLYSDGFDRSKFIQNDSEEWGSLSFIPRDFILDPRNGFLPGGTLTIRCDIIYEELETEVTIPKPSEADKSSTIQLVDDFACLFDCQTLSDVVLVVGEQEKQLHAHKAILGAWSTVFAGMFEHDMKEKATNKVELTDVDADVCEQFLHYLYFGKCDDLNQFAEKLLPLADKFQIDSLKEECELALFLKLSHDTVVDLLYLAGQHSASKLKTIAIEYISTKMLNHLKTIDEKAKALQVLLKDRSKLFFEVFSALLSRESKWFSAKQIDISKFHSWSHTLSRPVHCCHQWTIDQFSSYDKNYYYYYYINSTETAVHIPIESSLFFSPLDDQVQFSMKLYRNGVDSDSKDYLSVYLFLKSNPRRKIAIHAKISILDANGMCRYTREIRKLMNQGDECGWPMYIHGDLIKRDKTKQFISEDKMELLCEVSYVDGFNDIVTVGARSEQLYQYTMATQFEKLLQSEKLTDITIVVNSKHLRLHKAILGARSPVFASLFDNKLKVDLVEIDETDADVFEQFIRFVYRANTCKLEQLADKLLSLADKYKMDSLKQTCEAYLWQFSTMSKVDLLILADKYNATRLKAKVIEYIKCHTSSTLKSDSLKAIVNYNPNLFNELFSL